jgi:hypothetical protein
VQLLQYVDPSKEFTVDPELREGRPFCKALEVLGDPGEVAEGGVGQRGGVGELTLKMQNEKVAIYMLSAEMS